MSLAWLLLLIIFWQPTWWTIKAIYHLIKRDTWDAKGYFASAKGWFISLWELMNPLNAHK